MSLYPSLEDLKVDKFMQAQQNAYHSQQHQQPPQIITSTIDSYPQHASTTSQPSFGYNSILYPNLYNFMGLELSQAIIAENMPEYLQNNQQQVNVPASAEVSRTSSGMVAPLSGSSAGLLRGQVTNGIRELILCKDANKKVGLRVKDIDKGIFVSIVVKGSPAAMAGLRFGDQILQINGNVVSGYSIDALHKLLKKSSVNDISVIVRDRPFERAITLHKDSRGGIGFLFNNSKITTIVKDSTAARNGLLTNHHILEINGQNVVGLRDKEIANIIEANGQIITVTVIPSIIYDQMMKKLSSSFIRDKMDHSVSEEF